MATVAEINDPHIRDQFTDELLLAVIAQCRSSIASFGKRSKMRQHAELVLPVYLAAAKERGLYDVAYASAFKR